MKVTRIITRVDVLGRIWWPAGGLCAMSYEPRADDLRDESGAVTRDSIQRWIDTNTGDFSEVVDWRATVGDGDFDSDFTDEDNEMTFNDCMFPNEEED